MPGGVSAPSPTLPAHGEVVAYWQQVHFCLERSSTARVTLWSSPPTHIHNTNSRAAAPSPARAAAHPQPSSPSRCAWCSRPPPPMRLLLPPRCLAAARRPPPRLLPPGPLLPLPPTPQWSCTTGSWSAAPTPGTAVPAACSGGVKRAQLGMPTVPHPAAPLLGLPAASALPKPPPATAGATAALPASPWPNPPRSAGPAPPLGSGWWCRWPGCPGRCAPAQ